MAEMIRRCAHKLGDSTALQPKITTAYCAGDLHLEVRLPRTIYLESKASLPLAISLYCICGERDSESQQAEVTSFELELITKTGVRAGARRQSQEYATSLFKGSFTLPLQKYANDMAPERSSEVNPFDTQMGKLARKALMKRGVVSEFSTYNIHRAYALRYSIKIRALGRKLSHQQKDIPVEIPGSAVHALEVALGDGPLAPRYRADDRSGSSRTASTSSNNSTDDVASLDGDKSLPSYSP